MKDVIVEMQNNSNKFKKYIPVIAAGGIYDGNDMYDIMKLGADGVQLGSRFVTTEECDASDEFKQEYINAAKNDIEIIQSPVGMPGRAIHNKFITKIKDRLKQPLKCPYHCIKTCEFNKVPYCIIMALYNACKGNMNSGYAFAGSNAFRANKIDTVKQVFSDLITQFKQRVNQQS
jgi:NAD(P)H-dependent flavin oxidoreductase YrpB (nitropropane dioxygenase family)